MRTYEIAIEVRYTERVTVEVPEGTDSAELLRIGVEKAGLQNLPERATSLYYSRDLTPKPPAPPTDKQRFNAAFRELRKLGYNARQGLTPYDDGVDIYTMRDDAAWAFRGQELHGMMAVSWDYGDATNTAFHEKRVQIIKSVFESHGFETEWEGSFWHAVQVRTHEGESK